MHFEDLDDILLEELNQAYVDLAGNPEAHMYYDANTQHCSLQTSG